MTGWWNDWSMKCLVDEMTGSWNDWLMKCLVDEMTGWRNDWLMKWPVDETTVWWIDLAPKTLSLPPAKKANYFKMKDKNSQNVNRQESETPKRPENVNKNVG